jgi:hypothetical protein
MNREVVKKISRAPALLTFGLLGNLEKLIWPGRPLRYSPVFIVTPPRSGSTLLYQLMTGHLATCYFSNLADRLRVQGSEIAPALAAALVKWFNLEQHAAGSFSSYYGLSEGWGAPNEANGIWERWFPEEEHHSPPGFLPAAGRQGLYRAVAVTEQIFDRSFLNKCIRNSVRIEALAEIFPTALFIQCRRNPLDIAQSLFVARTRDFPFKEDEAIDPRDWWFSVKPKEYELIRHKGLVEQVSEQVYYVEQSIAEARRKLGQARFFTVDYERLCYEPNQELQRVVAFMNDHGATTRITRPVGDTFPYSTGCKIEPADYRALAAYLERLYQQPVEPMLDSIHLKSAGLAE